MSADNAKDNLPRSAGIAVAVFGPLVGVSVGWWLSAEAAREEALRGDQRDAYVEMIAAATDCGGGATIARTGEIAADVAKQPEFADLFDTPEAQALIEELEGPLTIDRLRECFVMLEGASSTVVMVTDDSDVATAAHVLEGAAIDVMAGEPESTPKALREELDGYNSALVDFEIIASADAHRSVPFLPRNLGRLVAVFALPLVPAVFGIAGVVLAGRHARFWEGDQADGAEAEERHG